MGRTLVSAPPDQTISMEADNVLSWRAGMMVGSGAPSATDTAFLQTRLGTLGKVMFIVAMSGVCLRALIAVFTESPGELLEPNFL